MVYCFNSPLYSKMFRKTTNMARITGSKLALTHTSCVPANTHTDP